MRRVAALWLVVLVCGVSGCSKREDRAIGRRSAAIGACAPVVTAMAVGDDHSCAVLDDHTVRCWGSNTSGQLGDGTLDSSDAPVTVQGISNAFQIVVGSRHSCVSGGNQVRCWGSNTVNQLGTSTPGSFSETPVVVDGFGGVNTEPASIAAGGDLTCTGNLDLFAKCWGDTSGVPVSSLDNMSLNAMPRTGPPNCVAWSGGTVRCWGRNVEGQLGNGTTIDSPTPITVPGISGVSQLATSPFRNCVVLADRSVKCWGDLPRGGLGFGSTPVVVDSVGDVAEVSNGTELTCLLRNNGSVQCRQGTATPFVDLPLTGPASHLALGGNSGCAALASGGVECWTWTLSLPVFVMSNPLPLAFCTAPDGGVGGAVGSMDSGPGDLGFAGSVGSVDLGSGGATGSMDSGPGDLGTGGAIALPPGAPCTNPAQCTLGFCTDGVCCDNECGNSDLTDCQACSMAAGAATDGTCAPLSALAVCRTSAGDCDVAESCDGTSLLCPPQGFSAAGTVCGAAPGVCQTAGACSGSSAACPGPAAIPGCNSNTVPACSGSCPPVDLRGGTAVENGISVEFQGGVTAGTISVTPCPAGTSPPTGFKMMVGAGSEICWDIDTSSTVRFTTPPPIIVCFHYSQVGPECPNPPDTTVAECGYRLVHDDGSGFVNVTSSLDTVNNIICGSAGSLSPFAVVEPLDKVKPVFTSVPGNSVVYASSTAGAKVTYVTPTAVDDVDGVRPVVCSRLSGTTFPVGKTTVTCTAADKVGNKSTAAFTVWVQYQVPGDGTFFLKPIRPDGSSIFRIGKAVPVKFQLMGASAGITNLVAKLLVTKISSSIRGTVEDVGDEDGEDTDFVFKYRPGKNLYGYRWKTRGETQGTYQLRADLGDGVSHVVNVSLRTAK